MEAEEEERRDGWTPFAAAKPAARVAGALSDPETGLIRALQLDDSVVA